MDLGGSGPLIVPGTKLIIGGGKRGKLYLMSPNASGTYQFSNPQKVYDGPEEQINEPVCRTQGQFHIMGGPVHWKDPSGQSIVYVSAESSKIRAYKIDIAQRTLQPFQQTVSKFSEHPGPILSLSANGNREGTGILWAVEANRTDQNPFFDPAPGVIRAFNAQNLSQELWNSGTTLGIFAKFTPVTVANGKVYAPTFSGQLVVYGLAP